MFAAGISIRRFTRCLSKCSRSIDKFSTHVQRVQMQFHRLTIAAAASVILCAGSLAVCIRSHDRVIEVYSAPELKLPNDTGITTTFSFYEGRFGKFVFERWGRSGDADWDWSFPIWPITAVLGAASLWQLAAIAHSITRRSATQAALCRKCNYNLTGNTSGICPECGTPCQS